MALFSLYSIMTYTGPVGGVHLSFSKRPLRNTLIQVYSKKAKKNVFRKKNIQFSQCGLIGILMEALKWNESGWWDPWLLFADGLGLFMIALLNWDLFIL